MTVNEYSKKLKFRGALNRWIPGLWVMACCYTPLAISSGHPIGHIKESSIMIWLVITFVPFWCLGWWGSFTRGFLKKHPEMEELYRWRWHNLDVEKYPTCAEDMPAAIAYLRSVLVNAGVFANTIFGQRDRLRQLANGFNEGTPERQAMDELVALVSAKADKANERYLALYRYMVTDAKYLIEGRYANARGFREDLRVTR